MSGVATFLRDWTIAFEIKGCRKAVAIRRAFGVETLRAGVSSQGRLLVNDEIWWKMYVHISKPATYVLELVL